MVVCVVYVVDDAAYVYVVSTSQFRLRRRLLLQRQLVVVVKVSVLVSKSQVRRRSHIECWTRQWDVPHRHLCRAERRGGGLALARRLGCRGLVSDV